MGTDARPLLLAVRTTSIAAKMATMRRVKQSGEYAMENVVGAAEPAALECRRNLPRATGAKDKWHTQTVRRCALLLGMAQLTACELPEAPQDLDDAARRYFRGFEKAAPDELSLISFTVDKQLRALEADGDLPMSSEAPGGALSASDFAALGLGPIADSTSTRGIIVASSIPCSFAKARAILAAQNQLALYPDLFTGYTRTYTSDLTAALSSTEGAASWTSVYSVDVPLYGGYTTTLFGNGRTVWGGGIGGERSDPIFLARGFTKFPATGGYRLSQQYDVEVMIPRGPNEVFHFFAVWLDMQGIEDSFTFGEVLKRFRRIERRTAELCAASVPEPDVSP